MFGVVDKETLLKQCYSFYYVSDQYEQFMTFWADAPKFDVNELEPQGKIAFEKMKETAYYFYPLVKEKGFYAWDISERIGLCRTAVVAGIISENDFWEITDNWVRMAQVFYDSFEEYALSCLCGGVYFMLQSDEPEEVKHFLELNINILNELFATNRPWDTICSINPSILAYLYAGIGNHFGYRDGKWAEE